MMKQQSDLRLWLAGTSLFTLAALYFPASAPLASGPLPIDALPRTISSPGSYCVTANLAAGPGIGGIRVTSPGVVIDLGGFTLTGDGLGSSTSAISAEADHVQVHNGTLKDWGRDGVRLLDHSQARNLTVANCGETGITLGRQGRVENCNLIKSAVMDIFVHVESVIRDCQIEALDEVDSVRLGASGQAERVIVNGGRVAFEVAQGSRLENCSATRFSDVGFDVAGRSILANCYARGYAKSTSMQVGFKLGQACQLDKANVNGFVDVGISAGLASTVRNSTVAQANSIGIEAGKGARIIGCTLIDCNENGDASGAGIVAGEQVQVIDCTLEQNQGAGILYVADGGQVSGCSVFDNTADGIRLLGGTMVRDNLVTNNAGTGLLAEGDRLVIRDNIVDANSRGIVLEGHKSLVIGNHATENTQNNFVLPWGNAYGPLVDSLSTIDGSKPQANFDGPE